MLGLTESLFAMSRLDLRAAAQRRSQVHALRIQRDGRW
jgi:hypothetical protein